MHLVSSVLMAALVAIGIVCFAGCSGEQAKPSMAAQIDANYTAAVHPASIPAADAKATLAKQAAILDGYWQTETTNIFAYWFGPKSIFVDAKFYADIENFAGFSAEIVKRTNLPTTDPQYLGDPVILNHYVQTFDAWIKIVKTDKDATTPQK
jgi:hypothetical protein